MIQRLVSFYLGMNGYRKSTSNEKTLNTPDPSIEPGLFDVLVLFYWVLCQKVIVFL